MNTLHRLLEKEHRIYFPDGKSIPSSFAHPEHAYTVQAVTEEGAPYTFATIFRNKHGRTNMSRVGTNMGFMAGCDDQEALEAYARSIDPASTAKVFLEVYPSFYADEPPTTYIQNV
jgi:hypothetical protein